MRIDKAPVQTRGNDPLNQTPRRPKELFSHFTRKQLPFWGACLKVPVLKPQIAFFFALSPEKALSHYEKKSLDAHSLEAIRKAAQKHKEALESCEGSPEAATMEGIKKIRQRLGEIEGRQKRESGNKANGEKPSYLMAQKETTEGYKRVLLEEITKREREALPARKGWAIKIALDALAEGLLEAGRKNKEGSSGAE